MSRLIALFIAFLICLSCVAAPTFQISALNDKFSSPDSPYGYLGKNNKLSNKSSQGGLHIDSKGVYLEPFVYKDRKTDEVVKIGFFASHYNFDIASGFRPVKKAILLTDKNDRVEVNFKDQDSDYSVHGWNTVSRDFNTSYNENAMGYVSLSDYEKLMQANYLEVKIVGGKLTQTYEKNKVLPSFLNNLKTFYDQQIKVNSTGK